MPINTSYSNWPSHTHYFIELFLLFFPRDARNSQVLWRTIVRHTRAAILSKWRAILAAAFANREGLPEVHAQCKAQIARATSCGNRFARGCRTRSNLCENCTRASLHLAAIFRLSERRARILAFSQL